jgi:uncharacterized RDD family membrane protein YckC/ribosomal protein L40E
VNQHYEDILNEARVLISQKDYKAAFERLKFLQTHSDQDFELLGRTYFEVGRVYYMVNDCLNAIKFLQKSLDVYPEISTKEFSWFDDLRFRGSEIYAAIQPAIRESRKQTQERKAENCDGELAQLLVEAEAGPKVESMNVCAYCKERIPATAQRCGHCGEYQGRLHLVNPPNSSDVPFERRSSYSRLSSMPQALVRPKHLIPAGFWRRVWAIAIDVIIFGGLLYAIEFKFLPSIDNMSSYMTEFFEYMSENMEYMTEEQIGESFGVFLGEFFGAYALVSLINMILWWVYTTVLESSPWQGTIGKKVSGLKVVRDSDGEKISFGLACGRYFLEYLFAGIPILGFVQYLMAAFTLKSQTLYDKICGTVVVYS